MPETRRLNWRVVLGLWTALNYGWSTDQVVKASTVLRNQPYGDQQTPVYAKCS